MSKPIEVDLAVSASWIVPVVPRDRVLADCSLIVNDGKIEAICPQADLDKRYHPRKHLRLDNSVLLPGLINTHGHSPMTLLRGYADDLPLKQWLGDHIWPAEQQWVSPEFVADGSELAIAEMLLSGTTCFGDMYFFPELTAAVAARAGIRAHINFPVFEFANAWAGSADECIHKGLALHDEFRNNPLIHTGFGPHAPYTVADKTFKKIATYMAELQMSVHIHLHETADEIAESIKEHGVRPIQRLANLDLLGPATQCVHFTQATAEDIELLQTWRATVIHCPESNMKLASGFCPVDQLVQQDVNVALGTDGAASNNGLNLFTEMKFAALLGKVVANRADALDAHSVLSLATINGAKALGLEDRIGSLEPGKQADFIALNLDHPQYFPMYDLISHLVYADAGHKLTHSWVAGQALVEDGQLTTLDLNEIKQKARLWQQKIAA